MKMSRGLLFVALVVALVVSLAGTAAFAASAKEEAKRHFDVGNAFVENEDYAAATAEFELSVSLFPTKMGLFNLANCYKAINKYGDALEALARLEREFAGKLGDLADDVASLKATVEGMVGRLDVKVDKDGAAIRVDGAEVGKSPLGRALMLASGDHVIEVRLEEYADASQTVRTLSGESREVSLVLEARPTAAPVVAPPVPAKPDEVQEPEVAAHEPAPVAPGTTQATPAGEGEHGTDTRLVLGHVAFWSGVAFLGVGVVGTCLGKANGDEWRDTGSGSAKDASRTWAGVMWAGYGFGAALVATGIVLWALPEKNDGAASAVAFAPMCYGRSCALTLQGEW